MNKNYSLDMSIISSELRLLLEIMKMKNDDSKWTLKKNW